MARKRRKVNFTDISDPRGITLTKSPANLSAFKVIRSNDAQQRSDLRAIVLPEGSDKAFGDKVVEAYGLSGDYSLREDGGTTYLAVNGFSTDEVVVPAPMGFGLTALIASEALSQAAPRHPVARSDKEQDSKNEIIAKSGDSAAGKHPELSQITFASAQFPTAKEVDAWLSTNDIDTAGAKVTSSKDGTVVAFCSAKDSHTVELESGVTAAVFPKAGGQLPASIYRSVLKQTYGYPAMWDSLDFAVLAANPGYIESSETALLTLTSVLENILLHSELSVEDKTRAVSTAVSSYESYTVNMLNSLPEPSFSLERHLPTSSTETDMSDNTATQDEKALDTQEAVTRSAEEATVESEAPAKQEEDTITVSRGELKDLIRDCLISVKMDTKSDAEAPEQTEEDAKRSDPLEVISAAMQKLAETNEALAQRVASVEKNLEEDSVTVARSAEDDTEQQPQEPTSIFRGVFG